MYGRNQFETHTCVAQLSRKFAIMTPPEQELKVKTVNKMALSENTVGLVLSSHVSPNARATSNDQCDQKYNPFILRPHRIGPNGFIHMDIRINIQGQLPSDFW